MSDNNILEFQAKLDAAIAERRAKIVLAVESVMVEMVSFIKENGPWKDRTGNLRNSIHYAGPIIEGDSIKAWICAGMEYALYVEIKPGYWVLSGAVESYKMKFIDMIKERVALQ